MTQAMPKYEVFPQENDTQQVPLEVAMENLAQALAELDKASTAIIDKQQSTQDKQQEIQQLAEDRSDLARQLDNAKARGDNLKQINEQVSTRIVAVMEKLRHIKDNG